MTLFNFGLFFKKREALTKHKIVKLMLIHSTLNLQKLFLSKLNSNSK